MLGPCFIWTPNKQIYIIVHISFWVLPTHRSSNWYPFYYYSQPMVQSQNQGTAQSSREKLFINQWLFKVDDHIPICVFTNTSGRVDRPTGFHFFLWKVKADNQSFWQLRGVDNRKTCFWMQEICIGVLVVFGILWMHVTPSLVSTSFNRLSMNISWPKKQNFKTENSNTK